MNAVIQGPRLSIVVPTIGSTALVDSCLDALRADGGRALELIVVAQGAASERDYPQADVVLRRADQPGFAVANNLGFAASRAPLIGTVNDDAVIKPGFCQRLAGLFESRPQVAAVQGLNLQLERPDRIDGGGIGFNRFWQAVQLGYGHPVGPLPEQPIEIFGVSATAALYRRTALERVARRPGEFFDPRLLTYYEDVELACRLRAAGFSARLEPSVRVHHLGSASFATLPSRGLCLIHANRLLVLADQLGRSFWQRLPLLVLRDIVDLGRAALQGRGRSVYGISAGLGRALRLVPQFGHFGAPRLPLETFHAFPAELPS